MSERQIELVWRCSSCGTKSLGRFMTCQGCGHPKDENVEYEMPERPEEVASVTDPELVRMATAGENWSCAFCGSDQRALDGSCGRCGAGRKEAATVAHAKSRAEKEHEREREHARDEARASAEAAQVRHARRGPPSLASIIGLVLVAMFLLGTCGLIVFHKSGPSSARDPNFPAMVVATPAPTAVDVDLTVTRAHWSRTTATDRWQLVPREGFADAVPADAVNKKAAGERVHHHEQVLDHMETVYDSVEVPDGYRTETYTDRVSCGQSCTTTPRNCRQKCTNNKNGFATCRDECTGGDQKCTTKYCDETRTRQIAKTRTERRPRQEPRYRDEPRNAPWFTFDAWDWVEIDTVTRNGDDTTPLWPGEAAPQTGEGGGAQSSDGAAAQASAAHASAASASATQNAPLAHVVDAGGAKTRERHTESFDVTLADDKGASYTYAPKSAPELADYAIGAKRRMSLYEGRVTPR